MMKWSKTTRLIVSIAVLLVSVVLSWVLETVLGDFSPFIFFGGAVFFIYVNPELMSGE